MKENEKASEKVIEYIETRILAGIFKANDRLPAERELARILNVSRTAVREGIRLLEVIGIVESRQGSGNYITTHFDQTLEQVLTMMYALDDLRYEEIREFRYVVERQALVLAVRNADDSGKKELKKYLDGMLYAESEEERAENDRMLHLTLVQMSGNRLVIANYLALNHVINRFIRDVRRRIQEESQKDYEKFQDVHRKLVESVLEGNCEMGRDALEEHFVFITKDFDT